jgi:hypothetical protein
MTTRNRRKKNEERGIALFVALIVLLLLAIIGTGFMFMADTENSVNNNYRDSQRAYFAARAGLENVRVLLQPGNPGIGIAPGPLYNQAVNMDGVMPSGTGGVIYVYNPTGGETVDPSTTGDYADDELCQELFANLNSSLSYSTVTPGVPCAAPSSSGYFTQATGLNVNSGNPAASDIPYTTTSSALPFKWVRITNKQNLMGLLAPAGAAAASTVDGTTNYSQQVCFDGTTQYAIPATQNCFNQNPTARPVWLLTALARTPRLGTRPGSKKVVQMEVALSPPIYPQGVVSAQESIKFNGSSVSVNSYDNCSCKCATVPETGLTACVNRAGKACNGNHHPAMTAGDVSVAGGPVGISVFGTDLTSPDVSLQNVNPWPYNIDKLINSYKSGATSPPFASSCSGKTDFTASPPVFAGCGTQTGQAFGTFPGMDSTGQLTGSPNVVDQITYVPGTVHLTGASGAGILIVDGDLIVDGGFQFYGLLLVRGSVKFEGGGSDPKNLYGAILAGSDVTKGDVDAIGGNMNLQYDVCALAGTAYASPRLLATHEIQY